MDDDACLVEGHDYSQVRTCGSRFVAVTLREFMLTYVSEDVLI